MIRKEWDAWISNFGKRIIQSDKIQNMTMGRVWFGVENDIGSDEAMKLKG